MIIQIENYTFDASAKTITFSDYASIKLESIQYIINATLDETIYNISNEDKSGTVTDNVLTLNYDTSGMSDSDDLYISYDDAEAPATRDNQTSGNQKTQVVDEDGNVANVDDISKAIITIDFPHHEIHEGTSFYCSYGVQDLGSMSDPDDTIQLHFTTPVEQYIHMTFDAQTGGEALFVLMEAPTGGLTNPTGSFTPLNRNRASTNISQISEIFYDGAIATGGTELKSLYVGQGGTASPGSTKDRHEWILKPNTIYAVRITDNTNITASIVLDWYEHTPE